MSLGFDFLLAMSAVELHIPFIAAIPFIGQQYKWNPSQQRLYRQLLEKAQHIEVVSAGSYSPEKMQKRNKWMVDKADEMIVCWDGSPSGTANCVRYALKQNKPFYRINPKELLQE